MKKERFLYCSSSLLPSKAANSIHVIQMATSLAKLGNEVVLTGKESKDNNEIDIFDFYDVPKNFKIKDINTAWSGRFSAWFSAIYTLLLAIKFYPKIVYGRSIHSIFLLTLFGFKGGYESHSPENTSPINKWLFKRLLNSKNVKIIITKSEALRKIILDEFGTHYEGRIKSVHDAAPIPQLNRPNEFAIPQDFKTHIGYVGHLYKGRGIELILNLAETLPHCFFHIIGGHNDDILYWQNKVKSNVTNVKFYGFVEPRYIPFLRSQMHILLAPYGTEVSVSGNKGDTSKYMSPLKVFEYMSSQKPIICSNHEVLKEVLIHNENAVLCPSEQLREWITAIELLTSNHFFAEKIANNAYNDFIEKYSWDTRAQIIYKFIS
jgi:glycosyltransferase involved in cell wall biosynthesis